MYTRFLLIFALFFTAFAAAGDARAQDYTSGLVGHWTFDDGSGTTVTDSGSGANNGTLYGMGGTPNWVDGKVGGALEFDGNDDFMRVASANDDYKGAANSLTISIWVYPQDGDVGTRNDTFNLGKAGWEGWALVNGGDTFYLSDNAGPNDFQCNLEARENNKWALFTIVVDRANETYACYKNGTLINSGANADEIITTNAQLTIGGLGTATPDNQFKGIIDDARIYNRALSAADVKALYNDTKMLCNADYEAVMIYNEDEGVLQYCDGTDWTKVGSSSTVFLSNAQAGYSLRNLTSTTQPVVRIRRSSDDVEQDFTATEINNGVLLSWVGAGNDGFVRTWYDQTGNNDAEQTSPVRQPKLINAGSLVLLNDKPGIVFDGVDDYLIIPSTVYSLISQNTNNHLWAFHMANWVRSGGGRAGYFGNNASGNHVGASRFSIGTSTGSRVVTRLNSSPSSGVGDFLEIGGVTPDSQALFTYNLNVNMTNATLTTYENGEQKATGSTIVNNQDYTPNNYYVLGTRSNGDNFMPITYQEVLIYDEDQTSNRNAIEGNALAYYMGDSVTCSSPDGVAGEMNYNFTQGVMQYCNGLNWVNVGTTIAGASPAASVPTSGLVGHWPLNGDPNDISGNGFHGVMKSGASFVPNPDGEGQVLQTVRGTDETGCMVVNLPSSYYVASSDLTKESAGAFWVMFDDRLGEMVSNSDWQTFMGPLPSMLYISRRISENQLWTMVRSQDNSSNFWPKSGGNSVPDENTWYHIAWSHKPSTDGSGHHKWYINGELVNTEVNTRANHDTSGTLRVGCTYNSRSVNVKLSQFLLYDRSLSAADVIALYEGTGGEVVDDPCVDNPAVGTMCKDGTVYADTTPDGGVPMFTTPCDYGMVWDGTTCTGARDKERWNDGTGEADRTITGINNSTTGYANTEALVTADTNATLVGVQGPHEAANTCWTLSYGGHDDWYLPANQEVSVLFSGKDDIGNFLQDGSFYWTSTEHGSANPARNAHFRRLSNNTGGATTKSGPNIVRCVRKGESSAASGGKTCSSPAGVEGEIVYNDTVNVMQYCGPGGWVAMR